MSIGTTDVRMEPDGPIFTGTLSSRAYPTGADGSGESSGTVRDIRWLLATGTIQVTFNGRDWLDRVFFEMFDA